MTEHSSDTIFRPQLILCPIDFSNEALEALLWAETFARCFGSALLIIYADAMSPPPYFTESQIDELRKSMQDAREDAQRHLAKYVQEHIAYKAVETQIIEDTAVSGILRTAGARQAGLIVMGANGMSGFKRFMLGSVTETVLHETMCPTLTVRVPKGPATRLSAAPTRILCPVNYSEVAVKALRHATIVAECFKAQLVALHVVEPGEIERGEGEFDRWVCSYLTEQQRADCRLEQLVLRGDPSEAIITAANEHACDLIVLGAQHKRFFDTTVIGKTTAHVIRHATCPVLTVIQK